MEEQLDEKELTKKVPFLKRINRRQFLIGTGALAAIGAVSGYTIHRVNQSDAKGKILIVGGGAAGMSMAARLARKMRKAEIVLIDPSEYQFYQPGFTLIGGGVYKPEVVYQKQESFIPSCVKWIRKRVVAVSPEKRHVVVEGGEIHSYDFLVLTPGIQLNWSGVEGVTKETLGVGNVHSIYDFQGSQKTFAAMKEFIKNGGRGVFTDTYTKLKCGGAPKKICLLTEHRARKEKRRDAVQLDYFTASKELYDVPFYTPRLEQIYQERKVSVSLRMRVKGVDTQAKKVHFVKTEVSKKEIVDPTTGVKKMVEVKKETPVVESYDFFHFAPPQSAPDFVREAGLGWREGKLAREAWVEVDKETLVHRVYPNIISLGDVAGVPTSKTSAAVRKQVPVAVENLCALMEGKAPTAKYNGYAACPIVTDYGHVLLCEFDYNKKPLTSFPFTMLDTSKEQWAAWLLKVYILKPFYFHLMLRGLA